MSQDTELSLARIDQISPYDKEIILLAALFFYAKSITKRAHIREFLSKIPEDNFALYQIANSAIGGDTAEKIAEIFINHPLRAKLFPNLNNCSLGLACEILNKVFENEEFCRRCEVGPLDYVETTPSQFALETASIVLDLQRFNRGNNLGLEWFAKFDDYRERQALIGLILQENAEKVFQEELPA